MTRNPAAYLFNGLFPNLARYLSGGPRYVSSPGVINVLNVDADWILRLQNSLH